METRANFFIFMAVATPLVMSPGQMACLIRGKTVQLPARGGFFANDRGLCGGVLSGMGRIDLWDIAVLVQSARPLPS